MPFFMLGSGDADRRPRRPLLLPRPGARAALLPRGAAPGRLRGWRPRGGHGRLLHRRRRRPDGSGSPSSRSRSRWRWCRLLRAPRRRARRGAALARPDADQLRLHRGALEPLVLLLLVGLDRRRRRRLVLRPLRADRRLQRRRRHHRLPDRRLAVRRRRAARPRQALLVVFTALQFPLTLGFGVVIAGGAPSSG